MNNRNSQKGFTLIELLVSIAILGIIVLIVGGALRLAHRSVESGEKKIEQIERIRTTLSIIDAQVQSALPLMHDEDGAKKLYFSGGTESLNLATNYSLWSGQKGNVIVTYHVETGNDGKKQLHVSEHTPGIDDTQETVLLPACDDIHFSYFLNDPAGEKGAWFEEWTDEKKLPEKIMLFISRGSTKISLNMPLRVRGEDDWILLPTAAPEKG